MPSLAWITSCRQASCGLARILVTGYLLDAAPGEVAAEALHDVAPELTALFAWGRMVPLEEPRPYLVRTYFLPEVPVIQRYREVTGKVVYLSRDPRAMVRDLLGGGRIPLDKRVERATRVIASPDTVQRAVEGHGNWQLHAREWTSPDLVRAHFPGLEDVCVLRYEDLAADPGSVLRQILGFLGVPGDIDDDRVRRTLRDWTAESVREAGLGELPPGMRSFRMPRPVIEVPQPDLSSLADAEKQLEALYQERLRQDTEFAALVKQFGYQD